MTCDTGEDDYIMCMYMYLYMYMHNIRECSFPAQVALSSQCWYEYMRAYEYVLQVVAAVLKTICDING